MGPAPACRRHRSELDRWTDRILDAGTLADVFAAD